MNVIRVLSALAAALALFSPLSTSRGATIQMLGDRRLQPVDVSDDGSTVVGNGPSGGWRWRREGGLQNLGVSGVNGVSADGTVVIGHADDYRPYRWTASAGLRYTGFGGTGYGVSGNGQFVVGASNGAYRWSPTGGSRNLGLLSGYSQSVATAVSFDGSVVVGEANGGTGETKGWRWTSSTGMRDLGRLPGSQGQVYPAGVSADGSRVIGTAVAAPEAGNNYNYRGFLWTQQGSMEDLGRLPGMLGSWAEDISGDGTTVVGYSIAPGGSSTKAFVWTRDQGMRELREVLAEMGTDLTGWTDLRSATGVSADGSIVTGTGTLGPFIAVIPEPSATIGLLVSFAWFLTRRIHRTRSSWRSTNS